jgi:hypothetical protein
MKLPIGIDDFKELIEQKFDFIDKSLFIKDVIQDGSKVILITRPRRFGKTLNMSMLYYYFTNSEKESQLNFFENLLINQCQQDLKKEYHQYPVIFISLKDMKDSSFKDVLLALANVMSEIYIKFNSSEINKVLLPHEVKYFKRILNKEASLDDLKFSLKSITEFISRAQEKKVVILIDEYDTPVHASYSNDFYDDFISFFSIFLGSALKGNINLYKAVMTGITRISQASIFSDLNNLSVYTILSDRYSEYFGFKEAEVEFLLLKYNPAYNSESIKSWYNGFHFGNNTVYNPWSILNCIKEGMRIKPYWVNTSSNDLIKTLIEKSPARSKRSFEKLLQYETILCSIDEQIVFESLAHNANALWSLLLFAGYLTITGTTVGSDGSQQGMAYIPNEEVRTLYVKIIQEWFTQGFDQDDYHDFLQAFYHCNVQEIEAYLKKYISQSGSYFDFSKKASEQIYHVFILGLVAGLGDQYLIKSNIESGFGRIDVALIPKDKLKTGIILEFKTANTEEELNDASKIALNQIEDKKYISIFEEQGCKKILLIGIAFFGKKLKVKHKIKIV